MTTIRFGTDGVRGKYGTPPIDARSFLRIGWAAGRAAAEKGLCVIGMDTRESGAELASAFAQGVMLAGHEVRFAGILPTAGLALAAKQEAAEMGAMITASHNPYHDNGIKLFARGGSKIPDAMQEQIERLLMTRIGLPEPEAGFALQPDPALVQHYRHFIAGLTHENALRGLRLVVDCANGAVSQHAPELLRAVGAEVIAIGTEPDGQNINRNCGSTHMNDLCARVVAEQAHVGIAFDGDADRVLLCDETGTLVDGDMILAVLACSWQQTGSLKDKEVVATVMSNMGLAEYLQSLGLSLYRTPVGDRHVAARLQDTGGNLGGEQSGHILFPTLMPSGDGLAAAMMVLGVLARSGRKASQVLRPFQPWPQILENVRYDGKSPLQQTRVQAVMQMVETDLGDNGRILVRASGTEPVIRVMAEAREKQAAQQAVSQIVASIQA